MVSQISFKRFLTIVDSSLSSISGTYKAGKEKLKLAEKLSDVGSEDDSSACNGELERKSKNSRAITNKVFSLDKEYNHTTFYPEPPINTKGASKNLELSPKCIKGKSPKNSSYKDSFLREKTLSILTFQRNSQNHDPHLKQRVVASEKNQTHSTSFSRTLRQFWIHPAKGVRKTWKWNRLSPTIELQFILNKLISSPPRLLLSSIILSMVILFKIKFCNIYPKSIP